MKKRIVSLLLVLCMVLSALPAQAVAAAFSDTGNSWAQKSIERLSTLGVIAGSNGSFRPDQPITRAEVATIYSNLMGYRAQAANTFSDLSSSAWYYKAMLKANAAMVFQGANGKINPDANITRQEFFVSFARVLGLADEAEAASFTDASDIASWALPQINALIKAKLLTGISNHDFTYKLEPLREITRAEVAALVDRAFPGIFKEGGTYSDAIKGNAVITVPDVTLSNLKIDGNLIIAEGVGEGEAIRSC